MLYRLKHVLKFIIAKLNIQNLRFKQENLKIFYKKVK